MTMTAIKHYLQFSDFTADEYAWVFQRASLPQVRTLTLLWRVRLAAARLSSYLSLQCRADGRLKLLSSISQGR